MDQWIYRPKGELFAAVGSDEIRYPIKMPINSDKRPACHTQHVENTWICMNSSFSHSDVVAVNYLSYGKNKIKGLIIMVDDSIMLKILIFYSMLSYSLL